MVCLRVFGVSGDMVLQLAKVPKDGRELKECLGSCRGGAVNERRAVVGFNGTGYSGTTGYNGLIVIIARNQLLIVQWLRVVHNHGE